MKNLIYSCILISLLVSATAKPEKSGNVEFDVRSFVKKTAEGDEGILNHYDRERSHQFLTDPRDWEATLAQMLDLSTYTDSELDVVVAIIDYRRSSDDTRVQKALIHFIDELYSAAAKVAEDEKKGIKEPPPKNPFLNARKKFARYATCLARMNDPGLLTKLLDYARSGQEEELRAFADPTYANIFIAAKEVGTKEHASQIRRLVPMLGKRGMNDKTIALAEEALVAIRDKQGPVAGESERKGAAEKSTREGPLRGVAAVIAGIMGVVILFLVFRAWKGRPRP